MGKPCSTTSGGTVVRSADGTSTTFGGCVSNPPTWYNALSDAGIEVNISCVYDAYFNEQGIQSFSAIIGSHTLSMTAALPTLTTVNGQTTFNYNGQGWSGGVTVDGTYMPPVAGVHTYLGGIVTVNIDNANDPTDANNWVRVNYTNGAVNYTITMNYDVGELGTLSISAVNAGMCGVPGGIWGQTLAGVDNTTVSTNQVATATSTAPEFNWSTCAPQQAILSTSHLAQ